jgi:transcription elongation GreA/GreB family factor
MDKELLVSQLQTKLREAYETARRYAEDARTDAKSGAPRAVNVAAAAKTRLEVAEAAWASAADFRPMPMAKGGRIGLGSIVEVEDGNAGKTLFLAPSGAGEALTGPDGDGFLQVVTPSSPLGRALMGRRVGDVIEVMVHGELTEWEITWTS